MDAALVLKKKFDSGIINGFNEASVLLEKSDIVNELLTDFDFDILNLLNRLTEIAEIPFAGRLNKVKEWVSKLAELSFCADGFSILGETDDILSCYNSMITSVLIRLEYLDTTKIQKGIDWILKYQNIERYAVNKWTGSRILKYGGCMKLTPCYIGVVKAMIALSDFKKQNYYKKNDELESKLEMGLNYILNHQVFKKQSNGLPITKDIVKLTYPFSYKTNIIEILRLLKDNNLDSDSRCNDAKDYLWTKQKKNGFWQVNSSYLPKCWVQFDKTRELGLWISYEIGKILD